MDIMLDVWCILILLVIPDWLLELSGIYSSIERIKHEKILLRQMQQRNNVRNSQIRN